MKRPTCETCIYWDEIEEEQGQRGFCAHNTPDHDGWPTTGVNDWCGKHQLFAQWALAKREGSVKKDEQNSEETSLKLTFDVLDDLSDETDEDIIKKLEDAGVDMYLAKSILGGLVMSIRSKYD